MSIKKCQAILKNRSKVSGFVYAGLRDRETTDTLIAFRSTANQRLSLKDCQSRNQELSNSEVPSDPKSAKGFTVLKSNALFNSLL